MIRTKSEALAAGKTHAVMTCPCGTKWIPLQMLPACPDDTALEVIAARYRCQRCGRRPTKH